VKNQSQRRKGVEGGAPHRNVPKRLPQRTKRSPALHHKFQLSLGQNVQDTSPKLIVVTLASLTQDFAEPDTQRGKLNAAEYHALRKEVPAEKKIRNREKDGPYIIGAVFRKPGTRLADDVDAATAFICDLDSGKTGEATIREKLKGVAFVAYTSYSHTPTVPKLRVVIPYKAPISHTQHEAVFQHFNRLFEGDLDPACARVAQLYYTPACPHDAVVDYRCFVQDGALFDAAAVEAPITIEPQKAAAAVGAPSPILAGTTVELDRVRSALSHVNADERSIWIKVGLALYNSFPDHRDSALMAWMDWSRSSEKFDHEDASRTWASFKTRTKGQRVTLASIYQLARVAGWSGASSGEPWVAEMNQKYFLSRTSGKTCVFEEKQDPVWNRKALDRMTVADFQNWLANCRVPVADDRGGAKGLPIAKAWMEHPDRRQYEGIVLAPKGEVPGYYNLWRGFSVAPDSRPGWRARCKLIRAHILWVICNGNRRAYRYLLYWMAFAVQHPDKPAEVAVVLQGGRGTGKGTFADIFQRLFGEHFLQISQAQHLTGNFNAHLRACIVLFVDEAFWAGDKRGEGVLKSLITERTLAIERKGFDVENVPNMLHIVMASNNDWIVPAGADERRFFVLEVSDRYQQNHKYFDALRREMNDGGLAALLHLLERIDLTRVNLRAVPDTGALREQKIRSFDPFTKWWFERLRAGDFERPGLAEPWGLIPVGRLDVWTDPVPTQDVLRDYQQSARVLGERYSLSATEFGIQLQRFIPKYWHPKLRQRHASAGMRGYFYHLPPLQDCRAEFEAVVGLAGYQW